MATNTPQILLVLGNIRAEQYAPVLKKLTNEGLKPEIVRVGTRLATDSDFRDEVDGLGIPQEFREEGKYEQYHETKALQLQNQIIDACFAGWKLSDVIAVIRDDSSDRIGVGHMAWLLERLSPTCLDYVVMNGYDGTQYIMSRFGTLTID